MSYSESLPAGRLRPAPDAAALAELAAFLQRTTPQAAVPPWLLHALRRRTVTGLLSAPTPTLPNDADALLRELCTAAGESVLRRPGWLRAALSPVPLPILLPAGLVQAAVLSLLRDALRGGADSVLLTCCPAGAFAQLCFWGEGELSGETLHLLRRLARGGVLLRGSARQNGVALRVPLCQTLPTTPAPSAQEFLENRYSILYQFLGDHCILENLH